MLKRKARPIQLAEARPEESRRSRFGYRLTAVLLACAVALGGRSAGTPIFEMLIQVLAVWLLVWLAMSSGRIADSRLIDQALYLMVATLVVGLLQLVPLPEAIWSSTSGGPIAADILRAAGRDVGWRPLTLDIDATRQSLLTFLPPFAIFVSVIQMDADDRRRLALIVLVVAAISIVMGLLQLASTGMYPYQTTHDEYSVGLFSNRNHQADLTLIAALLASAFYAGRERGRNDLPAMILTLAFFAIVFLNLVSAASRTGIVLGIPTFIVCAWLMLGNRVRASWAVIAATAAIVVVAAFLLLRPDLFVHVSNRFAIMSDDTRFEAWPEVVSAIQLYFPLGSGLGTFVPVHQAVENLDLVGERYLNHAHNDYLEIALEAGVLGLLLVLWFVLLYLWSVKNALFAPAVSERYRSLAIAAAASIAILLAHSVVDYSLRTSTLAAVFALCFAMLMPLPPSLPRRSRSDRRRAEAS